MGKVVCKWIGEPGDREPNHKVIAHPEKIIFWAENATEVRLINLGNWWVVGGRIRISFGLWVCEVIFKNIMEKTPAPCTVC